MHYFDAKSGTDDSGTESNTITVELFQSTLDFLIKHNWQRG